MYSTGGDTPGGGFRTVAQSARDNFGAEGYWSYLMLVTPQGYTDVNDMGVSLQNRGCGLFTVQTKYDYPIFRRLTGTIAVGWLRSDTPNPANGSTDMGTELGNDFTLDFGGGLKADMGAAVLFTGDFYKPSAGAPPPARSTRRSRGCNWSSDVRVCHEHGQRGGIRFERQPTSAQELHEPWILTPRLLRFAVLDLALHKCFGLHFQIDLGIHIGCAEAHMT